ncbi:MAG TPA: hypothetical protein DCM86_18480 [Verrucomicrobiales bacterium]|nr:hypothetical protein [Verrucomicrobiales bacterium]
MTGARFDPIAPHYRWMESVLAGKKLQRARLRWIDEASQSRHILLAGEGHGRFLVECRKRIPKARITVVDSSLRMLEIARRELRAETVAGGPQVEFLHASLPEWTPDADAFDLVVTNFFLDCFPPPALQRVVTTLAQSCRDQGRWLVSEFHVPPHGWRRWRARAILASAYSFFRIATRLPARALPDYSPLLESASLQLERRSLSEWGLLTSELWVKRQPTH